jgi:hypothetical protein
MELRFRTLAERCSICGDVLPPLNGVERNDFATTCPDGCEDDEVPCLNMEGCSETVRGSGYCSVACKIAHEADGGRS